MKRFYIFIIALLGCANWIFGAAPQIQSVDYVNKRFETSVIRANLVVATATFDQDLYFDANCTANPEALDISPCCSASVTNDCHTAQSTSFCIDGAYGSELSLQTNNYMTFEFQVLNPSTCDSVPIFVRSLSGDPDVAVSVTTSITTPTPTNNNYYFENTGSDGIVLCCSTIRALNPSWSGTVYFSVLAYAAATFDVEVRDSAQSISITDAWFSMTPQIICANESFVFQTCVLDVDYCQNLPPTDDPLFSFIASRTDLEVPLEYNSKAISWTFASSVQIFTSAQVSRTLFPFSASILSDSTCRVSFLRSLRNSDGEFLTGSGTLTERQLTCSASGFFDVSDGLSELLVDLQSSTFATEDDVAEYRLRSLAYAISNDWLGCVRLTENSLLSSTRVPTTINSTANCFVTDPTSNEYLLDPCCNPSLQPTQCCAPRDVIVSAPAYQINFEEVNKTCNLPACTTHALDQYISLSEGALIRRDVCSLETQKALNNPLFQGSETPLRTCQLQIFSQPCFTNEMCTSVAENSLCLSTGFCSLPCRNNTECATGNCTTIDGVSTCLTFNTLDEAGDEETATLIKCVEKNMNNYVALFIRSELGVPYNAPPATYVSKFLNTLVNNQTCLGPLAEDYKTNPTLCEQVQTCNWAPCDSLTETTCTQTNCLPPSTALGSDNFCGFCYGDACTEVSIFPRCQYKGTFGATGTICNLYNSTDDSAIFLGLPANNQRCIRATQTVADCFPANRCTATDLTNNDCGAYCYIKDVTVDTDCVGTIEDSTVNWVTWTRDATVYGACVAEDHTTITNCLLNATGRLRARTNWWPGTVWMEPRYESELACTGLCVTNENITDQATCLSNSYCDGCETCLTEEDCETAGTCDDFAGCVIPLPDSNICPDPYKWSPVGCYNPNITLANCVGGDFQWIPKATSRTECLEKGYACVDPSTVQAVAVANRPPPGYSAKNESECTACDGEILPYYNWNGAEWSSNVWFDLQWRQRTFGQANSLGRAIDNSKFKVFWQAAIAKRFANIMAREVLCRYGRSQDALENIACDCGTDRSLDLSQSCVANISVITDAVVQCCRSIVENTTSQATKTRIEVHADFDTDSDVDCINLKVYSLPQTQFNSRKKLTLSSISASLPQSGLSDQFRYVKNANVATVGEMIGDGVKLELTVTALGGLYGCIPIPTPNTTLGTAAYLDFAYPDEDYSFLTPVGLKLPLTATEYCFDLSDTEEGILFPIVLIENYENIQFIETISQGDLALIYIGVGIYAFVLGFTAFHFIIHIKQADSTKGFWNMATSALLILFFMLILRLLYLFFLSNGVLETARQADVVFSELPALLYLTIYSLIVIRWAEIYHFTMTTGRVTGINKLRPVVISVNVFLGAAFIVLAALFYNLSDTRVINCSTPATQELTDAEKVAIAYKVIFALICLGLAATFGIYGGRIIEMMQQTAKMAGRTRNSDRNKALTRLVIVSAVCAICLLAQAGNLLHGSLGSDRSFTGVLIFLYIVEIAPAIIFIFLFKKTSLFAQSADKKKAWVSSMRSRTKSGKVSSTVLQDGTNTGGVGDDVIAELDDMPVESH